MAWAGPSCVHQVKNITVFHEGKNDRHKAAIKPGISPCFCWWFHHKGFKKGFTTSLLLLEDITTPAKCHFGSFFFFNVMFDDGLYLTPPFPSQCLQCIRADLQHHLALFCPRQAVPSRCAFLFSPFTKQRTKSTAVKFIQFLFVTSLEPDCYTSHGHPVHTFYSNGSKQQYRLINRLQESPL